jgi:hypothetical protein
MVTSDLTIATSLSLVAGMVFASLAAAASFQVTPTTSADYEPGFRCSFWLPSKERSGDSLLQADDDSVPAPKALIAINGAKHMLTSKGITWRRKKKDDVNVGDVMLLRFDDEAVNVSVNAAVTWVCPRGAEGCEITRYRAKMRVSFQGMSRTVVTHGSCGS